MRRVYVRVNVSSHQGNVAWQTFWNSGVKWAHAKATERTYYKNPSFPQQYNGSYNVGMIRGAYHFATPNTASGAAQANYFVDKGGGWSRDGRTLPGVLDIEWNPYGARCHGLSQAGTVNWIRDFTTVGELPAGQGLSFGSCRAPPARHDPDDRPWPVHTMWQYTSTGPTAGDRNRFNGAPDRVQALANG